jgi:cell division protein FtsB
MRRRTRLARPFKRWLRSLPIGRESFLLAAVSASALWMGWSLLQEASLTHQLNVQAAQLRQENASLQASNGDARRDINSMSSGAAAEEEARKGGFSRPGETVYVVSSPLPTPPPHPAGASTGNPIHDIWHWLTGN